jgi:hypothetical protein
MAQNTLTLWATGRGEPARTSTVIEDVLGRPALTFAQWAADHADEFSLKRPAPVATLRASSFPRQIH